MQQFRLSLFSYHSLSFFALFFSLYLFVYQAESSPTSSAPQYLISYPSNGYKYPLSASFDPILAQSNEYSKEGNHRAQFREDLFLYENYFYGMRNGVIVESGALDGYVYSSSYMFENFLGWLSVHIEGHKGHYASLIQKRPNAININAALSNETRLYHYLHHIKPSTVDGILEFMSLESIQQFHSRYWTNRHDSVKAKRFLDDVYGITFSSILRNLSIPHVDLWILDVEGAELAVFRGTFPLPIEIDVIMFESTRLDLKTTTTDETVKLVESNGYKCKNERNNEICLRHGFHPSRKIIVLNRPDRGRRLR